MANMTPKVFVIIAAIFSLASSAPQVYEARGVHHPTVDSSEFSKVITASLDSLPQLTAAFKSISEGQDGSFSSDPDALSKIVSASLGITRESLLARQTLQGIPPSQNDLERLKAAESVLPTISTFMRAMGDLAGNANIPSSNPTGDLQLDTREYNDRMADVVVELLPDITQIFDQINQDLGRSNPNDPDYANKVTMAFMPLSKKFLQATAKAEGRVVRQEEFDRLNQVDALMPAVTKFMNSLRIPSAFESASPAIAPSALPSSNSGVRPLNLPSAFQRPAPTTMKQPAFVSQNALSSSSHSANYASSISLRTSQPAAFTYHTNVLPTFSSSSRPLKAPAYPEVTHINPPVYQAFIPTVPDTISGLPIYYGFSIPYGR